MPGRLHLSIVPVSTAHSNPNAQDLLRALTVNSGEEIRVYAHRDDSDPVALTLDVGIRSHQATGAHCSASPEKPETRFSCRHSWVALKQLHKELLLAVGGYDVKHRQCDQCRQIAEHLELCFKRAALFDRTWNGVMVLSVKKVTQLVSTLLRLARSEKEESASDHAETHSQITAVMASFLAQPTLCSNTAKRA